MMLGHPHCCWYFKLVLLSAIIFLSALKKKKKNILFRPALNKFMNSTQFPFGKNLPLSTQPWGPDLSLTYLYSQGSLPLPTIASTLYLSYLWFSSLKLWVLYLILSKGNSLCFPRGQLDNLINFHVLMWFGRIRHIRRILRCCFFFFKQIPQLVLPKCKC